MSNERKRLKEIIDVIRRHNLIKDQSPENIRSMIEDLGPTFVKMGQILSSRGDLIPRDLCEELKKLRCAVKPMPYEEVEAILNREYNGHVDDIFASIEETPIGSASIAQTHKGMLKTGETVAIKVQRKDIYQMMTLDAKLLKRTISILKLDKFFGNVADLKAIVDEMYESAKEEMDFIIEANHIEEFKHNNDDIRYIKPLLVYKEFSTPYVLVMEYIDGSFINDKKALIEHGYDMEEIASKLADHYMKQAIDDGFFHADPHSDNIKIQDGKIAYLDFGMMGRLSTKNKELLNRCMIAIIKNDTSEIADVLTTLDTSHHTVDYRKLNRDIKKILDKNGTTDLIDIDVKEFALDMFDLLNSNKITLPKDISMLLRGIVVLEGVLEEIDPNINLMQVLKNRFQNQNLLTKENLERLSLVVAENVHDLVRMPGETLSLLRGINSGEVRFNVELHDSERRRNDKRHIAYQMMLALLDLALIIGISILMITKQKEQPWLFYIYMILAIILTAWLLLNMIHDKKKQ